MLAAWCPAANLPDPVITVKPHDYGWFDAFGLIWENNPGEPFRIEVIDSYGIKVTKNIVEELDILGVETIEYQETEESDNYIDSQLVVTVDIQMEAGSLYSLLIPQGSVNIYISETEFYPNDQVNYSFTLKSDSSGEVAEPIIEPAPGTVPILPSVRISWPDSSGGLALLNKNPDNDGEITLSINGVVGERPEIKFEWESRLDVTPGSAGNILILDFPTDSSDGSYIINIPEGYIQISDLDLGTRYNEEMNLEYNVDRNALVNFNYYNETSEDNNIYDLNGRRIVNSLENVRDLPAGIYVIKGLKVNKK